MKYLKSFLFVCVCFVAVMIGDNLGEIALKLPDWVVNTLFLVGIGILTVLMADTFEKK